jgi:hypothetical protein
MLWLTLVRPCMVNMPTQYDMSSCNVKIHNNGRLNDQYYFSLFLNDLLIL